MVCEEHRNKTRICVCIDQKEIVTCQVCEEKVKDTARKAHFYIPALGFCVANVAAFMPSILSNLKDMQIEQFKKRAELEL